MVTPRFPIHRVAFDIGKAPPGTFANAAGAHAVQVGTYWDGGAAPAGRHFEAKLAWSADHLHAHFTAVQIEPLVISSDPKIDGKTLGLWDRDVCEIFVAPNRLEPRKYFEFETAPTGEWVDLAIDLTGGDRKTDTEYTSGMEFFAEIGEGMITIAMKIPWKAFGKRPEPGDVWLGNLFRCVGKDPGRGYLAWSPTMTEVPNFHVPERFGEFVFVD